MRLSHTERDSVGHTPNPQFCRAVQRRSRRASTLFVPLHSNIEFEGFGGRSPARKISLSEPEMCKQEGQSFRYIQPRNGPDT